jgi:hypothetical protein
LSRPGGRLPRPEVASSKDRGRSGEGDGEKGHIRNNFPVCAHGKKLCMVIALGIATSDSSTSSHRSRAAAEARGLREVEARGLEA